MQMFVLSHLQLDQTSGQTSETMENKTLQLSNCVITGKNPKLNAQGEPYQFNVVYLELIPTTKVSKDDQDFEGIEQYFVQENSDYSDLIPNDVLSSIGSTTISFRIYKSQFAKFIGDLQKCYFTFDYIKKHNVPIETKDYCSYEQSNYKNNKSILTVSGYKSLNPYKEILNIILKSWYIPQDGSDYVCTKNRIVFDPYTDDLKKIADFGKRVFTV